MKGFWYRGAVCGQVGDSGHKALLFASFLFSQYRQGSKRKSRPVSVKTFEDVPLVTTVKVVQEVSLSVALVSFPSVDVFCRGLGDFLSLSIECISNTFAGKPDRQWDGSCI